MEAGDIIILVLVSFWLGMTTHYYIVQSGKKFFQKEKKGEQ